MIKGLIILILCSYSVKAITQELEPRVYANLPKDMNAIAFAYAFSKGNILTDPSLPVSGFEAKANNIICGYVHTFSLAHKLARVQMSVPFISIIGRAKVNGLDTSAVRVGFGDMRFRFGINLLGSQALNKKEFRTFKQKTILGVSVVTSIPVGLYYADKRINLGNHRWGFKPEVGISKRFRHFYAEAYTGIWLYTTNTDYLVTKTLKQEAVFSIQGHIIYSFNNKMWIGVNCNWFQGGKTLVDDVPNGEMEDNWRIGGTWTVALTPKHSLKLQFHVGAFTSFGYDYNIVLIGYQYIFF